MKIPHFFVFIYEGILEGELTTSEEIENFLWYEAIMEKYNVEFVSTQEAFDTGSPYGELIVKILAVFAEFERQSIIQRVTQAYEHRSEMGFYMGGRQPYGFELVPTIIHNIKTNNFFNLNRI